MYSVDYAILHNVIIRYRQGNSMGYTIVPDPERTIEKFVPSLVHLRERENRFPLVPPACTHNNHWMYRCILPLDRLRTDTYMENGFILNENGGEHWSYMGPLMGVGGLCRMSILRNGNFASPFRLFSTMSHVEFKK